MLIAYVDESGNTGPIEGGGTLTFTLGCVLVDADQWPHAFDELVDFRRRLRDSHGILMRPEIKASYLLRNGGPFARQPLPVGVRHVAYRAHLRMLEHLPSRAFAVVVDKRRRDRSPQEVFNMAWETLLQRLERTSTKENVASTSCTTRARMRRCGDGAVGRVVTSQPEAHTERAASRSPPGR